MKRPSKSYGSQRIHKPVDDAVSTVTLMVGTAGHVDHGKTELIKLLTGCNTDRLPEEKARGMTIDLGFATCLLPHNRCVGIIDVPGHERFVHNMVAGAAGVDVVLLVIAADDGVMPQTVEHFHIARMLGVRDGFVAINKIDLTTPDRVEEVRLQTEELVRGSFLEGRAIVPVSARTAEGLDAFREAFTSAVARTAERSSNGPFRMHIERSFLLKGRGMIVTGVPCSGTIGVGDTVELLPSKTSHRIRSVQVYGRISDRGCAGECVAMNVTGLDGQQVSRGAVLAAPGYFNTARLVDVRFQLLPHLAKPLEPRTAVRFHAGTSDVPGHLVLPTSARLAPGSESYAQIQLRDPVVIVPGDPFIVRLLSPAATIGGGTIVCSDQRRIRRRFGGDWIEDIRKREDAFRESVSAVEYVILEQGVTPVRETEVAHEAGLSANATCDAVTDLVERGKVVRLRNGCIHVRNLEPAVENVVASLQRLHDREPLSLGFSKKAVLQALREDRSVLDAVLEGLVSQGQVIRDGMGYHLDARSVRLSPTQADLATRAARVYEESGFAAPRRDQLPELLGTPPSEVDPVVDFLLQRGDLIELETNVILHSERVAEARAALLGHLAQNASINIGAFKGLLDTTRKYVVPLLEHFDATGLTRRQGNERVLSESDRGPQ